MDRHHDVRKVAVVGGGVTGLSAAFYLYRAAEERGMPISVTLLEGSERLGGRVDTLRRDGFFIERGPDSFLARKRPMVRLAEELGLEDQLTGTNPQAKKTYIVRDGELHPMPAGLYMGVPVDGDAFLKTGLLSDEGKRRALEERDIPPAPAGAGDETVGAFLERRFGPEMVKRIFEPLLAGIYAGDLYALGLQAAFPQFRELERQYGSLIRGMAENRKASQAQGSVGEPAVRAAGSVFLTFRRGLSAVIEALEAKLRAYGCDIRLGARAVALSKRENASSFGPAAYRLSLEAGAPVDADAVVVALPASGIADLLDPHADVSAMRNINYVSVANVVFGFGEAGIGHPLGGSGFLVPRGEGFLITASTWTSSKWLHTAPEGKRLVRCYVGRAGEEGNVDLSDEEITAGVRRDLKALLGVDTEPAFAEITRLRRSMPQYPVGHRHAADIFLSALGERLPGVLPAGQPFGGVGLPDCVDQGRQAAEKLVDYLAGS
ncbi:protoporphyrinogen oxidase [Cohnella sp. CFH 77786]|uniref:protoporphyrinogen oxidase n=1 Tax=Cohnella sp. CFH 77786 TaxID=2662265 RepID=UPI001C6085F0|nr:protoporphyrinogen oxidase [Cohnella sp. CFH 77786]MBW5445022.1 protoporphyrinogen oxidase [Cohnella sp. CFH 77786]